MRICDLCDAECAFRIWKVAPNISVCPPCDKLGWRAFHEALHDRFGAGVGQLYYALERHPMAGGEAVEEAQERE